MESKKIKLYVLIPDKASGDYFSKKLNKHNIDTEYGYYYIHPRVINDKLTTSKKVVEDMDAIFRTFNDKTRSVVIACNTLQLWLDDIHPNHKKHIKIYTTFEACEWRYPDNNNRPLWLGTTPLTERTERFPTLISLKKAAVQNLVQELIWRIKMLYDDEIKTAFDSVKKDRLLPRYIQERKISELKKQITGFLKTLGIKQVILGCTELPMVFDKENENGIEWIDPAEVLAEYVKHQSVLIMFAGGTISSVADTDGTVIGGHVFNLVERLSKNMPGSFKHLNITKSDVVYSGVSENLTIDIIEEIWNHLRILLETEPARIVITHGTDAMEQTGRYIEDRLKKSGIKTKTDIVITGSNLPANVENSDAWKNLRHAINIPIPENYGASKVFIAFDHRIVPANEAEKIYIYGKNVFISNKSREYEMHMHYVTRATESLKKRLDKIFTQKPDNEKAIGYDVNIIRDNHIDFIKAFNKKPAKAVLFKLYHSGTANVKDRISSVSKLVEILTKKGVICFGATETGEPTDLTAYESSTELLKSGMVPLYNMIYEVALYKLQCLIGENKFLSRNIIIDKMLTNYIGEIDQRLFIRD